jgi:hypothetical protein
MYLLSKRSLLLATLGLVCPLSLAAQAPAPKGTARAAAAKPAAADPVVARPAARAPLVVHATPGGDTLLVLPADAPVQAVGREGEWTRVRIEGWTKGSVAAAGAGTPGSPLRNLSLRALGSEPERYRGQAIEWSAEYVSLQRADSLRTDLERGEWYVLARDPNGEPGFFYLAVPAAQVDALRTFSPLQKFRFVARVRDGRAPQMGRAVLELISVRP